MTCSIHHCELAECRMWAEIAQLPMTCYGGFGPTVGRRSVKARTQGLTPAGHPISLGDPT
jgi:hypothetical protein